MMDRKLARENMRMGWAMFVMLFVLGAGAFVYAAVYLANVK